MQKIEESKVSSYGIIDGDAVEDRLYKVNDLIEKPNKDEAPSNIAILGRYIIDPIIFKFLENASPGKNGEIQLTDSLQKLISNNRMYAYDFVGKRYDVGSKFGFLEATVEFALRSNDVGREFKEYLKDVTNKF